LSLADKVILLGDGMIQEEGLWSDLKKLPRTLEKITQNTTDLGRTTISKASVPAFPQGRATSDVTSDLLRTTGDTALYGEIFIIML
jgi:hypothetical protein